MINILKTFQITFIVFAVLILTLFVCYYPLAALTLVVISLLWLAHVSGG